MTIKHLEEQGIKSVESMSKEEFTRFSSDARTLMLLQECFAFIKQDYQVFECYDFANNKKQEFYITREFFNNLMNKV